MSQAFAEIRHFRKCLGNSGNAWIFLNCLGISDIGGGPRGQGVEPPFRVSEKLAPGSCGIKIRLG